MHFVVSNLVCQHSMSYRLDRLKHFFNFVGLLSGYFNTGDLDCSCRVIFLTSWEWSLESFGKFFPLLFFFAGDFNLIIVYRVVVICHINLSKVINVSEYLKILSLSSLLTHKVDLSFSIFSIYLVSSFLDISHRIFNSGLSTLLPLKILIQLLIKELWPHTGIIIPSSGDSGSINGGLYILLSFENFFGPLDFNWFVITW